jgi:hypothetical protein
VRFPAEAIEIESREADGLTVSAWIRRAVDHATPEVSAAASRLRRRRRPDSRGAAAARTSPTWRALSVSSLASDRLDLNQASMTYRRIRRIRPIRADENGAVDGGRCHLSRRRSRSGSVEVRGWIAGARRLVIERYGM